MQGGHIKVLLSDTTPDRAAVSASSPNLKIYPVQEVHAAWLERKSSVQKRDDSVFCKGRPNDEGLVPLGHTFVEAPRLTNVTILRTTLCTHLGWVGEGGEPHKHPLLCTKYTTQRLPR